MLGERYFIPEDVAECRVAILALEGRGPVEHFVDQNAQGPPVHGTGVPATLDHLRGYVLFSPDKGICPEIRNAGLGVNGRKRRRGVAAPCGNHDGRTARS